jgi:hypothetical protein
VDDYKTMDSKANFQAAEVILKDDQQAIRRIFHEDELELKDSPAMTATEAQIRYEWMNRLLGKTNTFIQTDLLGPILTNLLAMRVRLGATKPIPTKLKRAGIANIEYQGPLARSQRTDEVAAIERGATFVAGLTQFYPEVRACLDPVEAVKHVFQRLGVPTSVMPAEAVLRKRMAEITGEISRATQAKTKADEAKAAKDQAQAQGPVSYPELPPTPPLTPTGAVA